MNPQMQTQAQPESSTSADIEARDADLLTG